MSEVSVSGWARVGFTSARGGKTALTVSKDRLVVRCLKDYAFGADEVVAFVPDGPAWMSRGYRIEHNRADVAGRVYFFCSGGRAAIDQAVADAGFVPSGQPLAGLRPLNAWRWVFVGMAAVATLLLLRQHFG